MLPPAVQPDRLRRLFGDLVDRYSPSGKEEELTAFLADFLDRLGLPVRLQAVEDNRCNLLVGPTTEEVDLLLLGHIDTIPAYDMDDVALSEGQDGQLHGLGTADMKGGCAALVEAMCVLHERGELPGNVLLALVVGEEETGDGTETLLRGQRFKRAIVAEPTDLQPCLEHYGYVEMLVRTFGSRRHAAVGDRDATAVMALLRYLIRLRERLESEPDTVLNIRDLHSSEAGFASPDRCAACLDIHLPPAHAVRDYAGKLAHFTRSVLDASVATRYEIAFPTLASGYRLDPSTPLSRMLQAVFAARQRAWHPSAFRSHSDANTLYAAGCEPLILGPGRLSKAHTRDESVAFGQVVAAAELYVDLLTRLPGEGLQ